MKINDVDCSRFDGRIESYNQIILGLENSIKILKQKLNDLDWYDGLWFLEEAEPIYGLAFIAFQNYINGSIKDFCESTDKKEFYYKENQVIGSSKRSKIELIIGIANYSKHKDEGSIHKGTREILESFNINCTSEIDIVKSPIFEGLNILHEKWDLLEILKITSDWRECLWVNSKHKII